MATIRKVVRTRVARLAPARAAWEKTNHRGAVLDALRRCLQDKAPLPAWLGRVVEEAVGWWVDTAPTGQRGRQARFPIARREVVQDLEREEHYQHERARGLTAEDAMAMTAEFFGVGENTIRDSIARVKKMPPGKRYLAIADRRQLADSLRRTMTKTGGIRRWEELEKRYPPRHPTPPAAH